MKLFIALMITLTFSGAFAAAKNYQYKVETGDVGTIEITASTHSKAFEAAGEECFDRRLALYESQRGMASEERLLDLVDSCANLKW